MWFGRHAFGWFGHGYAPGLTGDEAVFAVVTGQAAPAAREVRVERRVVVVDRVGVAAGGVRLPDLDQLATQRLAVRAQDAAADDDPLAEGLTIVLPRQVVVELPDLPVAEDRAGLLGERMRDDDERLLR